MQSVEEFMRRFFDERLAIAKEEEANRLPFRRKFYANDSPLGGRDKHLRMLEMEKILEISKAGETADVVTTTEVKKDRFFPRRYRLQGCSDGWRIFEVEQWCIECRGKAGNNSCPNCQGSGWVGPAC